MPDQTTTRLFEKIEDIRIEAAGTRQTLESIDAHLGRLNSKVAKHEKEIGELKADELLRQGAFTVVKALAPAIWTVASMLLLLVLFKARDIVEHLK